MKTIEINLLDVSPHIRHCAWVLLSDDFYFPWRVIYDFEFIFVTEGELCVEQEGEKPYTVCELDFHAMPPMVWHRRYITSGKTCKYYNIHFDFTERAENGDFSAADVYSRPISNLDKKNRNRCFDERMNVVQDLADRTIYTLKDLELPKAIKIKNHIELVKIFQDIEALKKQNDEISQMQIKGLFQYMLGIIFKEIKVKYESMGIEAVIEKFKNHVENCYYKQIDLSDFLHNYYFSLSYFRKKFKEAAGLTPNDYITRRRIEYAVLHLKTGKYSIGEVADLVGFPDVYYFSSVFKKVTGASPSKINKK